MEHFKTFLAAWPNKTRPTSVEPVKVSFLTFLFSQNSLPVPDASVDGKIERIPFGSPALSARTPSARAEKGVSVAGRDTNAHPAASAGPAFLVIIAFGKFQGVIDAVTPIGCLRTIILLSF